MIRFDQCNNGCVTFMAKNVVEIGINDIQIFRGQSFENCRSFVCFCLVGIIIVIIIIINWNILGAINCHHLNNLYELKNFTVYFENVCSLIHLCVVLSNVRDRVVIGVRTGSLA